MTPQTEKKLIDINRHFYDTISKFWNNDPEYYWRGWYELIPFIQAQIDSKKCVSVLDLGCGNGRFLSFLHSQFSGVDFTYVGVDNAQFEKIDPTKYSTIDAKFVEADILFDEWDFGQKTFDIVVAFGLIHHIPGERLLSDFFANVAGVMNEQGITIVTTWQYMRLERLQKRLILGKERQLLLEKLEISGEELRTGDNFLDWIKGDYGIRFSHYFTEEEVGSVLSNHGIQAECVYLADDREQNRNQYFVIKKIHRI
jgi:tRNA (uracil-5-)-methyltransferase TRM9